MGQKERAAGKRQRRTRIVFTALAFACFCAVGFAGHAADTTAAGEGKTDKTAQTDFQRLEGRWVRPDGGYVLELREIKNDGSLKAAYYNPRPIKVYRAKWSRKDSMIHLTVELRDVNYPGSTYTLQYDVKTDRLKGTYFQAVERLTFAVEFARTR